MITTARNDHFDPQWQGTLITRTGEEIPSTEVLGLDPYVHGLTDGLRLRLSGSDVASFAKCWWVWDEQAQQHRVVRLGLGAYGDTLVARRFTD